MAEHGDIDIRYNGTGGIIHLVIALLIVGFGIFFISQVSLMGPGGNGFAAVGFISILVGLGFGLYGGIRFFDRGIKISLTKTGLKDHRTGVFLKWTDYRGLRLNVTTENDNLTAATMYVKVPQGDGEREAEFDVHSLDRGHEDIAQLVQKRGIAAVEAEAHSPEAVFASIMADVAADLAAGIPLSFAANKLVKRGMEPATAAEMVGAAARGENVARCEKCKLEYLASVGACSGCGGELSRVAGTGAETA